MEGPLRICHLSDLHIRQGSRTRRRELESLMGALAEVEFHHLVLTGDLTDAGRPEEVAELFRHFAPYLEEGKATLVPGNHDVLGQWPRNDRLRDRQHARRQGLEDRIRAADPHIGEGAHSGTPAPGQQNTWRSREVWEEILQPSLGSTVGSMVTWGGVAGAAMMASMLLTGRGRARVLKGLLVGGLLGAGSGAQTSLPALLRSSRRYRRVSRRPLFPFSKRIGSPGGQEAWLIGIDTNGFGSHGSITGAWGRVGIRQLMRLARLLADLPQGPTRIALCHHHLRPCPHSSVLKERLLAMKDAPRLEELLLEHGVRLVLHGHHHAGWMEERDGLISVGAPSSTRGDLAWEINHRPQRYFEILEITGPRVEVERIPLPAA